MRGEDFASIDQPPNHRLFNHDSDSTKLTPLLCKHLEDAKAANKANAAPSTAPTINFSIGKELMDFLRPAAPVLVPAESLAPPVYTAPLSQKTFDISCPTLLQNNRKIGLDITLEAVRCMTSMMR